MQNRSAQRVALNTGMIGRTTASLRSFASYAVLAAGAVAVSGTGALAQCTSTGLGFGQSVPGGSGAAVASIISTIGTINTASLAQSTAFVGTPSGAKPEEQGGGHWSRVVAGTVETNNNTSTNVNFLGIPLGTENCQTTTKQDYVGTQAGMDISRLNFAGGGNFHFGVTTGFFDITSKDRTPGQGLFSSDTQVAFAGLYAMINSGGFSFDAQVRGDFYHTEMNDVDNAFFNQSLDAKGAAFLWNASYTFNLSQNFFIRPSVGGSWSRTEIDNILSAGGFNVSGAITPSQRNAGTIDIDSVESLVGRATLTAGGTITTGNLALQPFASASVFHEFAGNVTARMETAPFGLGFPGVTATSTTSRVGTYAHFGLGIAGTIINTGWLGYIKGDYLSGDNIEALSVNAGLRYQFQPSGGAGSIKDGDGYAGHGGTNWTGLYAGMLSGAIAGTNPWTDRFGETQPKTHGYLAGGTLGYNHQIGHLVLGIEGDLGLANAEGGRECAGVGTDPFQFSCEVDINAMGSVTGRIGYARDRALFYVKGGLAVADVTARTQANIPPGAQNPVGLPAPLIGGQSDSSVMTGWTVGAGMEFAITDRWSAKAEYMHYDLGKETFQVFDNGLITAPADIHVKGDTVRIGVNYHFGHRGERHEPMK